jgi:predicted CopG family antitoxin
MVKNITIKDEAYEYLKLLKGSGSFSDVILQVKEQVEIYGNKVTLSDQALTFLNQAKKENESYSDIILRLGKVNMREHLAKYRGILSEESAGNILKTRAKLNEELDMRIQER